MRGLAQQHEEDESTTGCACLPIASLGSRIGSLFGAARRDNQQYRLVDQQHPSDAATDYHKQQPPPPPSPNPGRTPTPYVPRHARASFLKTATPRHMKKANEVL
ncbi:hypothetical protein DL766_002626 [Monosporascus sp. MC13-8B]|uniref:Uncharacterized protein n=1 Tax=Monosporascus cannonballus TaxID=155416 RepID=A0ABY0HBR7_9PEZI|nr:hypothetical protein DL762_003064 [Monosporascus cannonballus]RYO90284.1 hypothetical protein DL763_005368 [Monosporascus cannonballus]RYP35179.1 hypothetical protein DL766_002626 [Monosporascus sp. MC13-8B]